MATYPRPDFQRANLNWRSLNGPWSFLFDDNDIGVSQAWHLNGLPDSVIVDPSLGSSSTSSTSKSEHESITAKIAGDTQELLKGNFDRKKAAAQKGSYENKKRDIEVPYAWQCPKSGIEDRDVHEVFWYERRIVDLRSEGEKKRGDRVLIRFGAVDYDVNVFVDGRSVGGHRGGHVPFDIDLTDSLSFPNEKEKDGEHRLSLRVFDSAHDLTQPRGKQYWGAQPESIFYTPSGGIWQSVWMEVIPAARIGDSSSGTLLQSTDIEGGKLKANVMVLGRLKSWKYSVEMEVRLGDVLVSKTDKIEVSRDSDLVPFEADMRLSKDQLSQLSTDITDAAPLDNPASWLNGTALWSPEHPTLYTLTINFYSSTSTLIDSIQTTTGMRSLSWTNSHFRLNNRPYFQALFLDQGYWPATFMTPPSPTACKTDIELAKKMGFNGCRKHQKVEDPTFFYWADRLGFLVWSEMPNAYQFSLEYTARFDQEWTEAMLRDRNHPCVVAWTPVNESWAYTDLQHDSRQRDHIRSLYYLTKTLDPTRPVNDNCGWEHVCTDLTTFHDYSDADALTKICASLEGILSDKAGRGVFLPSIPSSFSTPDPGSSHTSSAPIICTEFGGVNVARVDTSENRDWGYTTATDSKDLVKRIEKMMVGIVQGGLVCGFVYTQLTDIEQEVNGLYTPEREEKLDSGVVRGIVGRVMGMYYEGLTE